MSLDWLIFNFFKRFLPRRVRTNSFIWDGNCSFCHFLSEATDLPAQSLPSRRTRLSLWMVSHMGLGHRTPHQRGHINYSLTRWSPGHLVGRHQGISGITHRGHTLNPAISTSWALVSLSSSFSLKNGTTCSLYSVAPLINWECPSFFRGGLQL